MKPYIFTERNGIHILDLQQTIVVLHEVYEMVRDTVADGGQVLFVGTKRQAQDTIAKEASRANQPYVNTRWLGGTLTNWQTIRQRLNYLEMLEKRRDAGEFDGLKKRERLSFEREIEKLNDRLGGIRHMGTLPDMMFVVDVNNEETAVKEANVLHIPVIAMVDTNCDPDQIDYIIPSNDDAIRAIKLMCSKIADAALEGQQMREATMEDEVLNIDSYVPGEREVGLHDADDEALLGAATLAKIRHDVEETVVEETVVEETVVEETVVEETIVEEIVTEVSAETETE
jgi:small subunit ribosomal protein S2